MPTLYLIDGHAQFFRAYHAIRSGLTSPVTHEPTNLTFGFVGVLLRLIREHKPDYLAVVIDASGDRGTFRSQIYPEYKAHRPEPPDDFHPQVERCLSILRQMNVPVLAMEGVEADDVLATLARRIPAEHPDLNVRILSRDKDLTQIIGDRVELFDVYKNERVTPDVVFETPGVEPRHVVDILSLMGDTVDNVPGVKGIGPKTAAKLVLEYGSLDGVLANLQSLKGKQKENIAAALDTLKVSHALVKLRDDLPVEFTLDAARLNPSAIPLEPLLATFRELNFHQHADALKAIVGGESAARSAGGAVAPSAAAPSPAGIAPASAPTAPARRARAAAESEEPGLFSSPATGGTSSGASEARAMLPAAPRAGRWEAILTREELVGLEARLRAAGHFCFDTETDGLQPVSAKLCGISLSIASGEAYYVPVRSPEPSSHMDEAAVIALLRPVFEDASIGKTAHNLKFDLNVMRRCGVGVRGALFDTMVASYVVDATRSSHSKDVLALALLNHVTIPLVDLIGTGAKQKTFDQVPLELAVPYSAEDADVTLQIRRVLEPQIEEQGLGELFRSLEMPLVPVLADLEWNGIRVEAGELEAQTRGLDARIAELKRRIQDAAPHVFNPDSPRQLAAVLFNKPGDDPPGLGLKTGRKGQTGFSTDQETLERLLDDESCASPMPALILEYRQLTKLVSTYLVALREAILPQTGRVHASFHQAGTSTGRLSSSDPNLQNIPIRTEVGRAIRRAFVADEGNVLIGADYSQIELRILAHLSEDPGLIAAFQRGDDIHRAVAAEVFGVAPDQVTDDQRSSAKMVNFGIIYGITPYGLARRLGQGTEVEFAKRIITDYKARFAGIDRFLAQCVMLAETKGYAQTMMGRRRRIPEIAARHPQQRALGERLAINSVVQGSAADLIKKAMIEIHAALPGAFPDPSGRTRSLVRMLLQIHDELVFEAPRALAEKAQALIVEHMERAYPLKVPLVAESAFGPRWSDA